MLVKYNSIYGVNKNANGNMFSLSLYAQPIYSSRQGIFFMHQRNFFYTQRFYLNSQTSPTNFFFFLFLLHTPFILFFITIHCCELWPNSSFIVVSSLVEAHCYGGSLASGGCGGGWCCGVTAEVHLFFLQL